MLKICNLCLRNPCHPKCPHFSPPKAIIYCSICGQGIYTEEEYIGNIDGEFCHWDCINSKCDLLKWFGYETKTMEDDYKEKI